MKYSVSSSASPEANAICQLINQGLDPRKLFIAAITFYSNTIVSERVSSSSCVVESGLYQGMRLHPAALGSLLAPKIQGTYEKEVQDCFQLYAGQFDRFLDVGCAEGFHLVGVASWKQVPCLGVDIDKRAGDAVSRVAADNGVSGLVRFESDLSLSASFVRGCLLCLVDVDGSEIEVLKSLISVFEKSSDLQNVILIVESDLAGGDEQNTPEIISLLTSDDWLVSSCLSQQPASRFVGAKSGMSFLDQVVWGSEGRSLGQSWIVARKSFD